MVCSTSSKINKWRWRSYLGTAGYSVEGCPNSNAYAHSMCGIPTWGDKVLSLEFTGLFSILYDLFDSQNNFAQGHTIHVLLQTQEGHYLDKLHLAFVQSVRRSRMERHKRSAVLRSNESHRTRECSLYFSHTREYKPFGDTDVFSHFYV